MGNGSTELTGQAFNGLLDWLGTDRDSAARRYEQIRSRLIKIFVCRGCTATEELADETLDRVGKRLEREPKVQIWDRRNQMKLSGKRTLLPTKTLENP